MYISAYHRQNPTQGCVIPTLSADVARSKPEIREAYRHKMVDFIRKMSKVLDGAEPDREKHAWSIVATSWTITIGDRGPGIPAESLLSVFRPYHRLDKSRNKAVEGVGLGLTVA
jgi:signal transduction histidine kinase